MFDVEALEIALLLEGVFQRFGRDFRHHNKAFVRRRLRQFMEKRGIATVSALLEKVMHEPDTYAHMVRALDGQPSGVFANPDQFARLRQFLVPWLRSCAAPKLWMPDCVNAEDAYAMAILLQEEGLNKTILYATGPNEALLSEARQGKFSAELFVAHEQGYQRGGGRRSVADYCSLRGDEYVFHPGLGENIVWSEYHLTSDTSINEFEAIVCGSGLACYTPYLKQRAMQIFYESQPVFGILAFLGQQSSEPAPLLNRYRPLSEIHGIFQRART